MNQAEQAAPTTPPGNPSDVFLNKKETAERLRVTVRTLENWQQRGVISFVKVGKVVIFHWPDVVEQLRTKFRVNRGGATK